MDEQAWKDKKVGVLYGGISSEREVSLKTGSAILKALQDTGYQAVAIDVQRELGAQLRAEQIEVAFVALHGKYGEDGCVQGLLELMGIPYTGSGVLASALAMNKILAKKLLLQSGIPTPAFHALSPAQTQPLSLEDFGFGTSGAVLKPASEGSSVGVHLCTDTAGLQDALSKSREVQGELLLEQYIKGKELTVGILNDTPMGVIQVVPAQAFYDFEAKYQSNQTRYLCPAPISEALAAEAGALALATHKAFGCAGVSRVDFMLDAQEQLWVLELNTIPGMTETSLVPKMAALVDLSFAQLCERILWDASLDR